MNIYCGTDIIEVERIKNAILKNDKFKTSIYSKNEIEEIEKSSNENLKFQRYAGRFASKEAIYKAISKILADECYVSSFLDVEILNNIDLKGRPVVNVINNNLKKIFEKYGLDIDLSISHVENNAIAMAVVNMKEKE